MSIDEFESQQQLVWKEWYLGIQGFFYFAQGVAMAAIFLLPVYMQNELFVSADKSISYQSIIMIPWYIKIIYGLLSDNVSFKKFGRRRPYIVIAGVLGIFGWITITLFKSANAFFLIIGIFLSLSVALSDAIIDSLAVDITPKKRRGWMQGVGWGGRGAGTALAGFILGLIIEKQPYIGWNLAYLIPGVLMILACFVALLYKEPEIVDITKVSTFSWENYKKEFSKKTTWMTTLFMIISGAGIAIISTYSTFLNTETSISIEGIGLGVTFFALGQFAGAILIGILGQYLPLFIVIISNTILYVGAIASLIFIPLGNFYLVYIAVAILGAINGGYETTQMRIGMEYSQGPIAGSLYNWYMSMSNVGQITLGSIIIAQLAAPLSGYQYSMQSASVFLILALIPAFFLIKWLKQQKENNIIVNKNMKKDEEPT
ncbi:MAG: MFS transporter [Candidatus Heimdallarchaeota archaeon]|nr:MFS transporter [Candidatus Heimdallarchaeota archaeon]